MPSKNTAAAYKSLVQKTLPFLHRTPNTTRDIKFGEKQRICSSEVWGVALWARKQQPGEQEVDFANTELVGFLSELAERGLPDDEGGIEMSDVCDGIIYSFSKI